MESTSPLNLLLGINSVILIVLILNQNESAKDSSTTQNSSSARNPLEIGTWVCLFVQLIFLVVKLKVTDF